MPFEVNQRVGDYEILGVLGAGGMGHVYKARNVISDRVEAMKVLLPDLTADRDLAMRFIAEIRVLASFDHPNIALLHTAFQMDNQFIMMMEYVEGSTLEQRAKQSPIPTEDVVEYIAQTLSALGYAHARNVVHRDIKPANLMLTSHGIVKLMDFGIAKSAVDANLTRPGTTIGSLYYMSPEQVRGDTIDGRSDLYSVGIVLYELLAGRKPFEAESTYGVLNQQLNDAPKPPIEWNHALPPQLNAIILKALAKKPEERYQTAEEFKLELRQLYSKDAAAPVIAAVPMAAAVPVAVAPPMPAPLPMPEPLTQTAPPAWQSVAPPTATPMPMPAGRVSGQPQPMPQPGAKRQGNKTLWIATGAIAAMLALVGVAIGLPHIFKTHASESAAPLASTASPAPAPTPEPAPMPTPNSAAPTAPSVTSPTAAVLAPNTTNGPITSAPTAPVVTARPGRSSSVQPIPGQYQPQPTAQPQRQAPIQPSMSAAAPPPPSASAAELDQLQERYVQLDARSQAALKSVDRLRRQQEASGLGMRGDMEAADARLRSYMSASNQDVNGGRIAKGNQDLDKAEAELNTLEKFLGH